MADRPTAQQELQKKLLDEIDEKTKALCFPMNERVIVYPVVLDEDKSVLGISLGKELAEMGIVRHVSYGANREQLEQIRSIEEKMQDVAGGPYLASLQAHIDAIQETGIIEVGDIVALNKFSGLDVPGTQFIAMHREDIIAKLVGVPVRLKTEGDWRQQDEERESLKRSIRAEANLAEDGIERARKIVK